MITFVKQRLYKMKIKFFLRYKLMVTVMTSEKKRTWTWKQAGGSNLKVVSNIEKGTIQVYTKNGECVLEKKNLTPEQVKLIEQQFLSVVTKKPAQIQDSTYTKFDPMVA
jgi:hypothetical protein